MKTDELWETYHHIAKLDELGHDERGNRWHQGNYAIILEPPDTYEEAVAFRPGDELCNTGLCYAGWYAALRGVPMNQCGDVRVGCVTMHVSDWVRRDAGLEPRQTMALFDGSNSLERIRYRLIAITGEDRG